MDMETTAPEKRLKIYEVGYLIVPTMAPEQVPAKVDAIKAVLNKFEASIIAEDAPVLRDLAYTMAKSANGALKQRFSTAYFGWIKFEASPNALPLLNAEFSKDTELVRFLLIETVKENTMTTGRVMRTDNKKPETPTEEIKPADVQQIDKAIESLVV